ncbi:tail fiber assembly protein [Cupriavidus basilensis]|uniref:Phage tail assembly chaperone n=1 Tax=Cupriavidus basilensis TaxID=68895 RepID=A0A643G4H6_9BURK|nr:tail fiber assembly protein [Cupriavidus basilensis]QOT75045.1 phage tail assembly chaperone [Cupriavidus basilensis]
MKTFYSKSTGGLYPEDLQDAYEAAGTWPDDLVEVPPEIYATLMEAQSAGRVIIADAAGNPVAVDRPAPSDADLAVTARARRDGLLRDSDWTQLPDVPAATKEKFVAYRQALRDAPEQTGFPQSIEWPPAPV